MASSENHGAKGRLDLQRHWTETSSTHVETFNDIWLEPGSDGKSVVLVHAHGQKNFIKSSDTDYREDRFSLSAEKLSSLIQQHGKKI
ncbi:hypothetical protein [Luteimonas abyssi]|uniref:hypothetical protein n=1 Tax=Luteimonas abyssi TaxID=1247514 RepID=UPI0012FCBFD9|nr:hypothetical protein [Luteimonas abyssi]